MYLGALFYRKLLHIIVGAILIAQRRRIFFITFVKFRHASGLSTA